MTTKENQRCDSKTPHGTKFFGIFVSAKGQGYKVMGMSGKVNGNKSKVCR